MTFRIQMRYLAVLFILLGITETIVCNGQTFLNTASVKSSQGFPELWVNERRIPPFAYMSYLGQNRFYKEEADHGLEIFCLPASLSDQGINSNSGIRPFRPSFWLGENKFDFTIIQQEFEVLTRAKKDAKVIVRVHLDPPSWWEQRNPSELCKLPTGESLRVSYSSDKWRHDAGMALQSLITWIKNSAFNSNLIGIHIAGGFTEEWFYHYKKYFYDESLVRKNHFRGWLRIKYKNKVSVLKRSWKQPAITFENAEPADISGMIKGDSLILKMGNAYLLDTYAFHTSVMVGNISYFSKLVKKGSDGKLLTGAFYGYHLFVNDPRRGHGSLADLLECPTLDYLSSPNDYRRQTGVDWMPMAAVRSVQLHGKLWMAENDTRTTLTKYLKDVAPEINPEGDYYSGKVWKGPESMETSASYLWKNAGRMLAYGYGGWWFDMWGGWFSNPRLLSVFQKVNLLYEKSGATIANTGSAYRPEVAVVVDEKLQFYDASLGRITRSLLANRYSLGNSGTSFDVFLRSDLDSLLTRGYKVIWYLGLHEQTQYEKRIVSSLQLKTNISLVTDPGGTAVYQGNHLEQRYDKKTNWSPADLRKVFSTAGVHIFSEKDDVVYAGNGWLVVHCKEAGKRNVHVPPAWKMYEVRYGKEYTANNGYITLDAKEGDTFLFSIR
jgi:beta-galactosidase